MKKILAILTLVLYCIFIASCDDTNNTVTQDTSTTETLMPKEITVTIDAEANQNNSFTISTNLPDNTVLMLTLISNDNSYRAQDKVYIYSGKATSDVFSNQGTSLSGEYTLEVLMPVASQQSQYVQNLIGSDCEYLKGDLVSVSSFGEKIVKAIFNFTLTAPKSELEIIKETACEKLTKSQKLSIIYWIEARYEYYDKIAGGYAGDKYTKTIFEEAALRYNKTYDQINAIWFQSYELKYN